MRKLMRRLKWVVIGLLAVVVALFVAAYAIITNYPVDDLKALIQDEVKQATGRELVIDGELKMEVLPSPAIVMNGVRLKNAAWGKAPEMLTIGHAEAEVAFWPLINGDIEVRRLVLSDVVAALERNDKGEANWHLGEGDGGGGSGTLPHFAEVRLEKTRVTFDDRHRGVHGTLTLDELNATAPDATGPMNVALKGSVDERPLDLKLILPAVGTMLSEGPKQIEIDGQVGETTLKLQGRVGPLESGANDFRLWLEGKDLAALAPGLPPGPFRLEALVQQKSAKTVTLSGLKGSLAGADFHGNLTLTEAAIPHLEGELHLGKVKLPGAASGAAAGGSLFPAEALPFALLHLADAKLTLTVQELAFGAGRSLSDLATRVSLEGGKLALDPLGFGYNGGNFTGTLHVDAAVSPPATKLRLKGSGLPLGVATDGLLQGSVDVDFDVAARGESPKAMAASLGGRTAVSSAGGTIDSGLASLGRGAARRNTAAADRQQQPDQVQLPHQPHGLEGRHRHQRGHRARRRRLHRGRQRHGRPAQRDDRLLRRRLVEGRSRRRPDRADDRARPAGQPLGPSGSRRHRAGHREDCRADRLPAGRAGRDHRALKSRQGQRLRRGGGQGGAGRRRVRLLR